MGCFVQGFLADLVVDPAPFQTLHRGGDRIMVQALESDLLDELPEPEKSRRCISIMEIASDHLCELGATVDAFSASLPKGPMAAPPESEVSWP